MTATLSWERAAELADDRNADLLAAHTKELASSAATLKPVIEDLINDGIDDLFILALGEIALGNLTGMVNNGRENAPEVIARIVKEHLVKYARLTTPETNEEAVMDAHLDAIREAREAA